MRIGVFATMLFATALAVAAPAPKAKEADGSLFVLDDCDGVFRGKANYEDNLSFIDRAGRIKFRVSGLNIAGGIGCNRRVAVDPARRTVWVHDEVARLLRKFDLTGKELLSIKEVRANALSVDPDTGNIWVLTTQGTIYGDKVVVFSEQGKRLTEHRLGGWDIAYDAKGKSFWIVGKHLCKVSAKQLAPARPGDVVIRKDIAGWCAVCVAVNQRTGQVWVVSRKHPRLGAGTSCSASTTTECPT